MKLSGSQEQIHKMMNLFQLNIFALSTLVSSSLPPSKLNLKVGCPVILLQNLSPAQGLCNGTHMVITQMGDQVLKVQLLRGERDGQLALIPQISLIPTNTAEVSFQFK